MSRIDGPPPLTRDEEIRTWRDMVLYRPPNDPIHRWARRRLVKAGLLDDDLAEGGDTDARLDQRLRPMRRDDRDRRGPGRDWL